MEAWLQRGVKTGERHTRKLQAIKARASYIATSQQDVRRKQEWAATVRWLIAREQVRTPQYEELSR